MKKNFKKRMMAMLIGMLFVLSAGSAYAIVDINAATGAVTYYNGIAIDATTGAVLGNGGTGLADLNVTCKFGFGASNVERYIRYDLSNGAKFSAHPASCVIDPAGAEGGPFITTRASGGAGSSYVIYSIPAVTATPDVDVVLTLAATPAGVTVYNTNSVTVTYSQYAAATDALSGNNSLVPKPGTTYITFGTAVGWEVVPVSPYKIDVTSGSKKFVDTWGVNTTVNTIGHVKIFNNTTPVYNQTGTATIGLDDIVDAATTKFTVTGDFSSLQDSGIWVPANQRVWLDSTPATPCNNTAKQGNLLTLSATKAEFAHDSAILADTLVCMEVNGINTIASGFYNGLYDVTPKPGYSQADIDLGQLSELKKNGSQARLTFLLTPESMYKTYVRVVNPSETNGAVYLTLFNDTGTSVNFNLNTVSGMSASSSMVSGLLKARASTPLISMADIVAAAKAVNSAFDATTGKLRIDAEAEFGSTTMPGWPGTSVTINAFSMMSDGTGFVMMPY